MKITILSCLLLLNGWWSHGLKRAPTWRPQSATQAVSFNREILPELRGGYLYYNRNQPIELNPDYKHYTPPPPGGAIDDNEEWLKQQSQLQSPVMAEFHSFQPQSPKRNSLFDGLKGFVSSVHGASPCVAWTAFSCITIFILWQIPSLRPSLARAFVCSRGSVKKTAGISLILSSVSHVSLYHLVGNLITLLGIAPGVARGVTKPLWPLFLGSAVCSNVLFVGLRRYGSCIGLSGVTMAVIAVQAMAAPNKVYTILLAGIIPISLPAKHMLSALLAISFLGSFVPDSKISHLSHLGGLLFGLLYYEMHVKKARKFSPVISWSS